MWSTGFDTFYGRLVGTGAITIATAIIIWLEYKLTEKVKSAD